MSLPRSGVSPFKVLIVGKGYPESGGIPTYIDTICRADLGAVRTAFLNLATSAPPQGGRPTFSNIRRTAVDSLAVWRQCRDADVVHIHTAFAPGVTAVRAGLLSASARARGCRVAVHVHGGMVPSWLRSRRRSMLTRLALRPAHRVFTVSSDVETVISRVLGPRRVRRVENFADTAAFHPLDWQEVTGSGGPPTVLYVGLLSPRKGVLDLITASELATAEGFAHRLVLVGGVPNEGSEGERVVRERLPSHATAIGPLPHDQMPDVYRLADAFCLPSWWEAMPMSLLEAMATGLPVIATDVGDVSRVVHPGETGYLVPSRSPERLAEALATVLGDLATARSLGRAARALVVRHHSLPSTATVLLQQYREMLEDCP